MPAAAVPSVEIAPPFGLMGRTALSAAFDDRHGVGDAIDSGDGRHGVGREWRGVTEVGDVADLEVDPGGDVFGDVE